MGIRCAAQEYKLLSNYNDKPLMTKPQHKFFLTPEYLEVDLDIHAYAYLARKVPSCMCKLRCSADGCLFGCPSSYPAMKAAMLRKEPIPETWHSSQAFYGFMSRLDTVIFENAFVVQGNRSGSTPPFSLQSVLRNHLRRCSACKPACICCLSLTTCTVASARCQS